MDKEYLNELKNFDNYYENTLYERLKDLENQRKKYLYRFINIVIFVSIWIILIIADLKDVTFLSRDVLLNNYVATIICFWVIVLCYPLFTYYKRNKESLLPLIINYFGNFKYNYDLQLPQDLVDKTNLFKKCDKKIYSDTFIGNYKGINILISEYDCYDKVIKRTENERKESFINREHGIIIQAEMNKKFRGKTLIVKDRGILNSLVKYKNLKKVGLESITFEKLYEVYSDDQVEARYLLTPIMLEYLVNLKDIYKDVELTFFDNQVFIKIKNKKNMFECVNIFTSILNRKRIDKIFKQLYIILSVLETIHITQTNKDTISNY